MSQQSYVKKVLKRFSLFDSRCENVSLSSHFNLSLNDFPNNDKDKKYMNKVPHFKVVGSLMYNMVCTRLVIAYTLSIISKYMFNPSKAY